MDTRHLEGVCEMLKKRAKGKAKPKSTYAFDDPQMQKALPNLYDHLAQLAYEKGEERKTSSLSLFQQDGQLKVFINDKNEEESLCVSGSTWEGLWEALEAALGDEGADWRHKPEWNGKKKK